MKYLLILFTLLSVNVVAEVYSSGDKQIQLIELYTSEGCSSCPPADNYLTKMLGDPRLWRERIPVAFHVDYWDYIGWKDRFASNANSQRQRTHARQGNVKQVYTPGFVVAGEEWRSWFLGERTIPDSTQSVGVLQLNVTDETFTASFAPTIKLDKKLELHVALLGFGLVNAVDAGENHGRKLVHNFVMLDKVVVPSRDKQWQGKLPVLPSSAEDAKKLAIVAWVSEASNIRPVQATGGWLP